MNKDIKLTTLPKPNIRFGDWQIEFTENALNVLREACKQENKQYVRVGIKGGRM